jgi:hypothetical protein
METKNTEPASRNNGAMGVAEGVGAGVFGGHRAPNPENPLKVTTFPSPWLTPNTPGAGVFGVSQGEGNGVWGQSHFGHGVIGASEGGVEFKSHGVFGQSTQTAGVVGISGDVASSKLPSGHAGVFGFCDQGTGVFGSSNGTSTHGVRGSSVNGDGVFGTSETSRDGIFQSGTPQSTQLVPQLQLVPQNLAVPNTVPAQPLMFIPSQQLLSALPKAGQPGDFLATMDANRFCTLWFCVHGQDGASFAQWSQVLLGVPMPGGG